jgi:hypothetical protein
MCEDTKGPTTNRKSKKDRQEKFEDTKGVISIKSFKCGNLKFISSHVFNLIFSGGIDSLLPKGQPQTVNRRRTDNAMVKRKREKIPTIFYKTLHSKLNIEQHEPNNVTWGELRCSG